MSTALLRLKDFTDRDPFLGDPITYRARKAIFNEMYLKRKQCIGIKLCMEVTLFVLQLCEKNSSVNILRLKIFVMAFRDRKLLSGTSRNEA